MMSRYDQWATREPPWSNGPDYVWQLQFHCEVCGCWLKLEPDRADDVWEKARCEGPNTDIYGQPVAGWIYTPCESDCQGPHEYQEYQGVKSVYICKRCGFDNELMEY